MTSGPGMFGLVCTMSIRPWMTQIDPLESPEREKTWLSLVKIEKSFSLKLQHLKLTRLDTVNLD